MANTNYATSGILGIDFDARDTTQVFPLGSMVGCNLVDMAIYVQADTAINASSVDLAVAATGQLTEGLGNVGMLACLCRS